jgi:hypothetical protein
MNENRIDSGPEALWPPATQSQAPRPEVLRPEASQPQMPRTSWLFGKNRAWLNVSLFVLTAISIFFVGLSWSANYKYAEEISRDPNFAMDAGMFKDPQIIFLSALFTLALILILLGHEMGHYLTCRRYRLKATLPYFIPAPTLLGTMGAFIRIKSPITRKRELFDVGIAGPLMSFVLSVPTLVAGLFLTSKNSVYLLSKEGTLFLGDPLLLKVLAGLRFGSLEPGKAIVYHPLVFAGWAGLLVTAMNLFPIGQLDGGHIAYALLGPRAKSVGRIFLGVFAVLGVLFWAGWLVWAAAILLIGMKHPPTWDAEMPLGTRRKIMGGLALVIFILSFIPDPVQGYNVIDVIKQLWP